MPHRTLHENKGDAIIRLCNLISPSSVSAVKTLANGEDFKKIIDSRCPDYLKSFESSAISSGNIGVNCKKEPESTVNCKEELESAVNCKKEPELADDDSDTDIDETPYSEITNPNVDTHEVVLQRYRYIQKFIDDRYHLQSDKIISYDKCMESCELELAKVALFVLCEAVRCSIHLECTELEILFHLDVPLQEELEEIFKLFITEREKISKPEIERLLCKSARNVGCSTPRRSCASKYRDLRYESPSTPKEEIFSYSPLKSFFESPIFRKEDLRAKEIQIENLKKVLDEAEEEAIKLQGKIKELEEELKIKDFKLSESKKRVTELEREIEVLCQGECKNVECQDIRERLKREIEDHKPSVGLLGEQLMELSRKYNAVLKENDKLKEDKEICLKIKGLPSTSNEQPVSPEVIEEVLETKTQEIQMLKEELDQWKQKASAADKKANGYKKKLSEFILSSLKKEPLPPGKNSNDSYEEIWKSQVSSISPGENIGQIIDEENKILQSKLKEAELRNQELLKELETQKQKMVLNKVCACKIPQILSMPELIDMSKTAETEKLRNALDQSENMETSHLSDEHLILNSSSTESASKNSRTVPHIEVSPGCETNHEAVLWKGYDSFSENENLSDINCDLHAPENSETINPESICTLGDLNFNFFLDSLKILSPNGSFKKVLEVHGKLQSELKFNEVQLSRAHLSDLQKLLNIITECISLATASHTNLPGRSGLSTTDQFENENKNVESHVDEIDLKNSLLLKHKKELEKEIKQKYSLQFSELKIKLEHELNEKYSEQFCRLKDELENELGQKYAVELNELKEELKKLKKANESFEEQNKDIREKLCLKKMEMDELRGKYHQLKIDYHKASQSVSYYKEIHRKYKESNQKKDSTILLINQKIVQIEKANKRYQMINKKLSDQRDELMKKVQELTRNLEDKVRALHAVEESHKQSLNAEVSLPVMRASVEQLNNHENSDSIATETHFTSTRDGNNESILSSSALYRQGNGSECFVAYQKSIHRRCYFPSPCFNPEVTGTEYGHHFQFESQNEEDFLNHSSLADIKKDYQEDREEELRRRNSVLPLHLQTSYPIEVNERRETMYVKGSEKFRNMDQSENDCENNTKKRKFTQMESETQSNSITVTPLSKKGKRKLGTPTHLGSLLLLMKQKGRRRIMKPKQP